MPAQNAQPSRPSDNGVVAPFWHTAALIALIVAVAVTGTILHHSGARETGATAANPSGATSRVMTAYLPAIVVQIGLAWYVCRVGRPRNALVPLLGKGWNDVHRALVDLALALLACGVIVGTAVSAAHFFDAERASSATVFLPVTPGERFAWFFVAAMVGFCEEVVYRGYLQTQLAAFTSSGAIAVTGQALLFGIAHADQGASGMAITAVCGAALGVLARARSSLAPGIIAHIAVDLGAGVWRS